ncbi:Dabb family protein [Brucella gallinifaecis]|uniref:Dabb family protein n=2 Tax=Brucella gallinifaecis TaxID=215590 RepID=A0A502BHR3_9HYPH|nr:Dabb family protein [Brucella gallinifaecis]
MEKDMLHEEQQKVGLRAFTASEYKPGTIQHIVLFKYKKSVTSAQIQEVRRRFLALKTEAKRNGMPYIQQIEAGAQNSGEGADKGFQEGFIVTFLSEGDRNYYVGSPVVTDPKFYDQEHQKFKTFVGPLLANKDGVLVFDFTVRTK